MKIEFNMNLDDFRDIADDCIEEVDFKQYIVQMAIQSYVDKLFGAEGCNSARLVRDMTARLLDEHKDEIINKIVDRVSVEIEKQKRVRDELPNLKDFNEINSEWKNYFKQLIDRAIAEKFH